MKKLEQFYTMILGALLLVLSTGLVIRGLLLLFNIHFHERLY